ncbi:MAG: NAD-dependent epimerase/dehydratase family protein, partial [Thiogranum sp.]
MAENKILVTGGAGYIGSHVVRLLTGAGKQVVVLDNLSTGFSNAVIGAELIVGDTGDRDLVTNLLAEHKVDT